MNKVEYLYQPTHALMQTAFTQPSPALWRNCPWAEYKMYGNGITFWEDFLAFPATAEDATGNGWLYAGVNAVTTALQTDQVGGVIRIGATGATHDECSLQYSTIGGMVKFTAGKPLWFEARVKPSAIAAQGLFIGLAEEGAAADEFMVDTSAVLVTTKDMVGFRTIAATPTKLDAIYQKGSQTLGSVKTGAVTMVATEWYKLGYYFDGRKLYYYTDGVELPATTTHPVSQTILTGSTFPDGEEVSPIFAVKTTAGVVKYLDIDWVKVAMERP